jgi:NADH-quinone oxidoreductase subunit M
MGLELHIEGSHLLSLLVASPLAGVLVLVLIPRHWETCTRWAAVCSGFITLILSLVLLAGFQASRQGFQFAEYVPWLSGSSRPNGNYLHYINYIVGVDGLSLSLIVLTTILVFLVLVASPSIKLHLHAYLGSILLLETGMLGVFVSLEAVTFYVFWELMLIPMYFLIGIWGGERRVYAALKFVLYTAAGSLLMLVAIVYLAQMHEVQYGRPSFYFVEWMKLKLGLREELLLFSAFALAFAIKVPIVPLHTWLPDAHVEAPTGASVILAGVLLKMGLYGLIRFCIPVFPSAVVICAPLFTLLGVIGIVYGALVAWVQDDVKRLVAYSSISHLGFCVLGFSVLNTWGLQGAMLQMFNHGVSTAALFFAVGVLYERKHTRLIADFGGVASKMPVFGFVFMVFVLSSIGLPLTNGFVGEFLILFGSFNSSTVLSAIGVSGIVLGSVYMLSCYRRIMFGTLDVAKNGDLMDLSWREKFIFAPLLALVVFIGVYPQPVLDYLEPPAKEVLHILHQQVGYAGFGKEAK